MKWSSVLTWGQALADGSGSPAQPNMIEVLAMPLGLLIIMYFFMIRPQIKKNKEHQQLLTDLKAGDEVVTSSGIIGRVKAVADAFVTVDIAPNTPVKFTKASVTGLTKSIAPVAKAAPAKG